MFLIILGFLVWLFATGKFADWQTLAKASPTVKASENNAPAGSGSDSTVGNWSDIFNSIYNPNPSTQGWSGQSQWDSVTNAFSSFGQGFGQSFSMIDPTAGGGG